MACWSSKFCRSWSSLRRKLRRMERSNRRTRAMFWWWVVSSLVCRASAWARREKVIKSGNHPVIKQSGKSQHGSRSTLWKRFLGAYLLQHPHARLFFLHHQGFLPTPVPQHFLAHGLQPFHFYLPFLQLDVPAIVEIVKKGKRK